MQKASDAGLDLVEVSPQVDPPVCAKFLILVNLNMKPKKKLVRPRKNKKKLQLKKLR